MKVSEVKKDILASKWPAEGTYVAAADVERLRLFYRGKELQDTTILKGKPSGF